MDKDKFILREGAELTLNSDIVSIGGHLMFEKGQKVIVREIETIKGHWSNICRDIYVPEYIIGIRLAGHAGSWRLTSFIETAHLK